MVFDSLLRLNSDQQVYLIYPDMICLMGRKTGCRLVVLTNLCHYVVVSLSLLRIYGQSVNPLPPEYC